MSAYSDGKNKDKMSPPPPPPKPAPNEIIGLSFGYTFLSALLVFCLPLLLLQSSFFSWFLAHSPAYFPDISFKLYFPEIDTFFLVWPLLSVRLTCILGLQEIND